MQYRSMRYPADNEFRVEFDGREIRARLVDISPSGARLKDFVDVQPGARIVLCHLYRRIPAEVVWHRPPYTGVRFATPLGNQDLDAIRGVTQGHGGVGSRGHHGFREMS